MEIVISDKLTEDSKAIRESVFVNEQGFTEDYSDTEQNACHIVFYEEGQPIATGRCFAIEEDNSIYQLSRVAVKPIWRGMEIGSYMVNTLEQQAKQLGAKSLLVISQTQAQPFYEKLGYIPVGEPYLVQNSPHIKMKKTI